jgi:two-component system phosphate regulon response regulator PhoB
MEGTILVLDEDSETRQLLTGNLRHAGYRAECASSAAEAEARVRDTRPDVALLEWGVPDGSALSYARKLRADPRTAGAGIIMISARAAEHDKVAALECGADDYVTKPFSTRELLARIKALMRRRCPQLADDVVELAGLRLDPAARRVTAGERELQLWTTEFRMLHFFMTHAGRVFVRAKLLDEIWGDHVFLEERTVDVHIRQLRQALAPSGHDALLETVRGVGYRFRTEAEARAARSTVTDLARFRGLPASLPSARAA